MAILKIAAIPCMFICIGLMLMVLGLIPSKRIIDFLNRHSKVQAILGIMVAVGLISSFFAVM